MSEMKTEKEIRRMLEDKKQFYQKVKSMRKRNIGVYYWIKALEWVMK